MLTTLPPLYSLLYQVRVFVDQPEASNPNPNPSPSPSPNPNPNPSPNPSPHPNPNQVRVFVDQPEAFIVEASDRLKVGKWEVS